MIFLLLTLPPGAQADTNALPDLAPAYPELPATFWEQHEAAVIVAGLAFLAVVILLWRVLFRPGAKAVLPPEVLARDALAKVLRQPEDGNQLSGVSQVLRRYLVSAFALPPGEMTTAEFCAVLAGHEPLGAELARGIAGFLHECDERKFSASPAAAPLQAAARALEFVALSEKRRAGLRAPIPAADP